MNEFIAEFEGAGKSQDITRWRQFTDIEDIKEEMLNRREDKPGLFVLADPESRPKIP